MVVLMYWFLDDEKVLEIRDLEIESDFQLINGLRVSVAYEEVNSVIICMLGQIVK
tara:strand:- start:245 stop:409 length:165 start_codon:yes stop_codon:yes gene_type:complete